MPSISLKSYHLEETRQLYMHAKLYTCRWSYVSEDKYDDLTTNMVPRIKKTETQFDLISTLCCYQLSCFVGVWRCFSKRKIFIEVVNLKFHRSVDIFVQKT
ncbi:hypothetical protein SUGI_0198690 [Cryptomeria japonica]|nr:hypothetical protein SUGI_0198690 [Cryptomeria japonica]